MVAFSFVLWIVLNGKITLELILFGALIALIVYLFAHAAFGYSLKTERLIWRFFPLILRYFVNLVWEIFLAAIKVVKTVWKSRPDPVIIEFHSGLPTAFQNVILANSITLTPGTITGKLEGSHFTVHCLDRSMADGIEDSVFVRQLQKLEKELIK